MNTPKYPMSPHEELFMVCQQVVGPAVWAVGMSTDEEGKNVWEIYCSNKRKLKKAPKTFTGRPVRTIYCEKPGLL